MFVCTVISITGELLKYFVKHAMIYLFYYLSSIPNSTQYGEEKDLMRRSGIRKREGIGKKVEEQEMELRRINKEERRKLL